MPWDKEGSCGIALLMLNLGTRWGCGQCHALSALLPGNRPGTYSTGSWVGPRSGLDGCGEEKICWHHRLQTPNCPVCSKSLYWLCHLGPYIKLLKGHPMIYLCRQWGGGRVITICKLALKGDGLSAPRCVCFTPGKTWYLVYRRLDGPWGLPGWHRKFLPHRDSIVGLSSPQWFPLMTMFFQHIKLLWQYNVKRTADTILQQRFSDVQYWYAVLTFQQNKELCRQHG
jgi:hypothetical protein